MVKKKALALFLTVLIICLPFAVADSIVPEPELNAPEAIEDVAVDLPLQHLEFEELGEGEFEEEETGESIMVEVKKYEPTVLVSSLIEDDDVPIYAFLSGKSLGSMLGTGMSAEPLYSDPEIKYMRVTPLDEDTREYVRGTPRFLRPKKYTLDNLGTLLIMLKQIEIEGEVPDSIELNMNAIIEFENAERLFTLFQQDLLIPEDRDEDIWRTKNLFDYSFFSGRGYIRAEEINDNSVKLTIYASEAHLGLNQLIPTFADKSIRYIGGVLGVSLPKAGEAVSSVENYLGIQGFSPALAPRPIRTIYLNKGETSDYLRLRTAEGMAQDSFRVKLVDVTDPTDRRARLKLSIDGTTQEVIVTEGSALYPGSMWRVESIKSITRPDESTVTYEVTLKSGSEIIRVEKTENAAGGNDDPCESAEVLLKGLTLPEKLSEAESTTAKASGAESTTAKASGVIAIDDEIVTLDLNTKDILCLDDYSLHSSHQREMLEAGHYLWAIAADSDTLSAHFFDLDKAKASDVLGSGALYTFKNSVWSDIKESNEEDMWYKIQKLDTDISGGKHEVSFDVISYFEGTGAETPAEASPAAEEVQSERLVENEDVVISSKPNTILDLDDFSVHTSEDAPALEEGDYLWVSSAGKDSLDFKLYMPAYDRSLLVPIASSDDEMIQDYSLDKENEDKLAVGGSYEIVFPELRYSVEYRGLSEGNIKLNVKHYDLIARDTAAAKTTSSQATLEKTEKVRDTGSYACLQPKKNDVFEMASVTVYDNDKARTIKTYADACVGTSLSEYSCEGKSVMKSTYKCSHGCENGKCRKAEKGLTTKVAATIAIPASLPTAEAADLLSNTPQEAVYCTAIKEFKKVIEENPGVTDKFGVGFEHKAAFEIARIYDDLGYPEMAVEYYLKSLQAGKGDFAVEALARIIELSPDSGSGSKYRKKTISDNGRDVTVQLKSVQGLSDKDKPSIKIEVEEEGVKTLKAGDKLFRKDFIISEVGKPFSYYNWRVKRVSSDAVYIEKFVTKGDQKSISGPLAAFSNQERLYLREHNTIEGKDLYVREIDVKKNALLRIIPGTGLPLRSRSNFTIHIPVEKRAISWTPDEIGKKINKTEDVIKTFDSIIEKFDDVLSVWKKTCLITFAYLTIKNSLFSGSSRSMARNMAMRGMDGKSGWSAFCASNSGRGLKYKTYDKCLADNAKNIAKTIDDTQKTVKQVNSEMKNYENQEWFANINKNYKNVDKYADVAEGELYSVQELRDYRFWQLMSESQSYQAYDGENAGYNYKVEVDSRLEELNFTGDAAAYNSAVTSIEKNYAGYTSLPLEERKQIFNDLYKQGMAESQEIKSESYAYIESMGIQSLQVIRPAPKQMFSAYTMGGKIELDIATAEDYRDQLQSEKESLRIKADAARSEGEDSRANSYETEINNYEAEVQRLEKNLLAPLMSSQGQVYKTTSGETKFFVGPKGYSTDEINTKFAPGAVVESYPDGRPYCVPSPSCDGNYIKVLEFFADNTPKTVQEWNVGKDGLMCTKDDVMIQHHSTLSLPQNEAELKRLISKASRAGYKKSGEVYSDCGRDFIVSNQQALGQQQTANPGCYDVMDPEDCKTLFGICDPVMCPPSRFNLAGAWPVDNVVQTGIIGSLVLGLHNYDMPKEPIPVCLTGVKAGLENIRSILKGYVECLKTAKVQGKSVGICDKVRSIFICETLWKEALAILKIKGGIFRWIGKQFFGEKPGGGEYLTFESSMQNIGDSVKFFTKEYATTSFAAFNARSTDEVGSTICKAAIYGKWPDVGEIFEQISTPESPPQYTAVLTVIPYSETMGKSRYQIYYHVYAGENQDVDYSIYLRDARGDVSYVTQECHGRRGSIEKGGLADFTVDCILDSGFNEVCINVNGWTECGFGKVSSSFAVDYLNDLVVKDEVGRNISSELDCVPTVSRSSPSLGSVSLPGEYSIVSTGVVRVCSKENPGRGTDANNWKIVGACGMDNVGRSLGNCWISLDSVNINNLETRGDIIDQLDESTLARMKEDLGYSGLLDAEKSREEMQGIHDKPKGTCVQVIDAYRDYSALVLYSLSPVVAAEAQYYSGKMLVMLAEKQGCTMVDPLRDLNRIIVEMKDELSAIVSEYNTELIAIEAQYTHGTGMDDALKEKMEEYLGKVDSLQDKYVKKAEAVVKSKNLPAEALASFEDYIKSDLEQARLALSGGYESMGSKEVSLSMIQHYGLECGNCGDGMTNLCDRDECYSLANGKCFFVDGSLKNLFGEGPAISNECKACLLAAESGCSAIEDEARCNPDSDCVRSAGLSCQWSSIGGGKCISATGVADKTIQEKENLCMECEDGVLCTKGECHEIPGCYFSKVDGGLTRVFVDDAQCHTCEQATTCVDFSNDPEMCETSFCTQEFGKYCRWDGEKCVDSATPVIKKGSDAEYRDDCFVTNGFGEDFACMTYDDNTDYKLDDVLGTYLREKKKLSESDIKGIIAAIKKYSKEFDVNPYVIIGTISLENGAWNKNAKVKEPPKDGQERYSYGLMQCLQHEEAKGDIDEGIRCGTQNMARLIYGTVCKSADGKAVKAETFVQMRVGYTAGPGKNCANIIAIQEANGDVMKMSNSRKQNWKDNWPRAISLIKELWQTAGISESVERRQVTSGQGYKFVIVGDVHYRASGQAAYMDEAIDKIKELNPDFLIITGDMVDATGSTSTVTMKKMWSNFKAGFVQPLKNMGIKIVPVRGNHDSYSPEAEAEYEKLWDSYGTDIDVVSGDYPVYYSFNHKGDHFAIIEDSRVTEAKMVDWLRQDLADAKKNGANRIFVSGHRPIFYINPCHSSGGIVVPPIVRADLVNVLREYNAVYIHGHVHAFAEGSYDSVSYIDSGALSTGGGILGQSTCVDGKPFPREPQFVTLVDLAQGKIVPYTCDPCDNANQEFDSVYSGQRTVGGKSSYSTSSGLKTWEVYHNPFDYSLLSGGATTEVADEKGILETVGDGLSSANPYAIG
ncbi:MAG: metallophosphoesterase [Candidatus Woesearchaeota archaeon]